MDSNISTKGITEFKNRIHLPQCQSTNDELLALIQSSEMLLPEGFMVTTDHQLAGRGQRGSIWEAEPGKNLLFSILFRPGWLPLKHSFWLSAAVATGICKALQSEIQEIKVKWPNDIFVEDKKLGGILMENSTSGQFLDRSILGIGINVNQTDLPPGACSLKKQSHVEKDKELILEKIIRSIHNEVSDLKSHGWQKTRNQYYLYLYRMATLQSYELPDGKPFKAIMKGISEEGKLILLTQNGEQRFSFKEVSFVNPQ